jgi:hypothetical protein
MMSVAIVPFIMGEGNGSRLDKPCPEVRLSQDRMPIELLTQQHCWARWEQPAKVAPKRELAEWPTNSKAG